MCLVMVCCVTLFGMVFVLFCMCCVYVVVWFVCDRVCGGVWLVAVDCLCACGLKITMCVCGFCVGLNM